ncbi:MAG: non-canonical purine NTP pyrophosphatase, partial [Schleiferiaceae bacterium]
EYIIFEGIVRGTIATERMGAKGFGYDPIFVPEGHQSSFAQMDATAKNAISHRGRAIRALVDFLIAQD